MAEGGPVPAPGGRSGGGNVDRPPYSRRAVGGGDRTAAGPGAERPSLAASAGGGARRPGGGPGLGPGTLRPGLAGGGAVAARHSRLFYRPGRLLPAGPGRDGSAHPPGAPAGPGGPDRDGKRRGDRRPALGPGPVGGPGSAVLWGAGAGPGAGRGAGPPTVRRPPLAVVRPRRRRPHLRKNGRLGGEIEHAGWAGTAAGGNKMIGSRPLVRTYLLGG